MIAKFDCRLGPSVLQSMIVAVKSNENPRIVRNAYQIMYSILLFCLQRDDGEELVLSLIKLSTDMMLSSDFQARGLGV